MKRRYTILFFVALSPLIGLSWLAAQFGASIWDFKTVGVFGMLGAAVVSAFAMLRSIPEKWPAFVAAGLSVPSTLQLTQLLGDARELFLNLGMSFALITFGPVATFITALVVAIRPPPRPQDLARARVVD